MMEVKRLSLEEWKPFSKDAHLAVFEEFRDEDENTFDYALLVEKDGIPQCYSTCIEFDKYSCYMQHGGAFPSAKGTTATVRGYNQMIDYLKSRYPVLLTKVKNTNTPMLKLALSAGFLVHGLDVFGSDVYVRLIKECV